MQKWIPPRLGRTSGAVLATAPHDAVTPDGLRHYVAPPLTLAAAEIGGRDIGFCAELAACGGTSVSSDGFTNERELFRLHAAGLLDLFRRSEQPFPIVRVALSDAARRLVGGAAPAVAAGDGRRQGFEVARAMIGAAVKTELADWCAAPHADMRDLERRLLGRIDLVAGPFRS